MDEREPELPRPVDPLAMNRAFEKSLLRWVKSDSDVPPEAFASFERAVSWCGLDAPGDDGEPFIPGHRFLVVGAIRHLHNCVELAFGRCGSPIERMMLSALLTIGYHKGDYALRLFWGMGFYALTWDAPDRLFITPQEVLGEHRVDFLLRQESTVPDFQHPRTLPDGQTIPGTMEETRQLIIECDGHDFHDRTREQASRDRARDRSLQSLGYQVFRYTGSDLWRDVFAAASEALTHLYESVYPPRRPPAAPSAHERGKPG